MGESSPRFTRGASHSKRTESFHFVRDSGKTFSLLMSHDLAAQFKLTANASTNNFDAEE